MNNSQEKIIAIFNHGGGLRGLISAHLMTKIEERTNLRMSDMVDIFCGPSTGSILNAALTLRHPDKPDRPKYKARHLVRFYEREGIRIFPPDMFRSFRGIIHDFNHRTMRIGQLNNLLRHGHYNPEYLGRSLRALYGRAKLTDCLKSLIIPAYNIDGEQLQVIQEDDETQDTPVHTQNNFRDEGGHAVWFKNIHLNHPPGTPKYTADVPLYDCVMASCAAPTFFPCHHFDASWPQYNKQASYTCIDGSIFDNPCISYHGAIRQHLQPHQELVMICLGTGYTNQSISKEDWNRHGSLGLVDPVNDLPLINIFFHAPESALFEAFKGDMNGNLYVFNKSLLSNRDQNWPSRQIDDGSTENLRKMKHFAELIIEENQSDFDAVCHILVSNHENKKTSKSENKKSFFSFFQST